MSKTILVALIGWFALTVVCPAQTFITNVMLQPPATTLEAMESTVGKVVFKSRTEIGTISTAAGTVTIYFKEDSVVGENGKAHGLAVAINGNDADTRTLVDYDELESLMGALDYLSRLDWSITPMSNFDASYTTKAGLRVDAFGNRRSGRISFSLRSSQTTRISLASEHLVQLRSLLDQAKRKLDELRRA